MIEFFEYGNEEIEYLKKKDARLGEAIDAIGMIERAVNPDIFSSLINTIVGQQISTKAQKTVWRRMNEGLGAITPATIDNILLEDLQKFGLSFRKAEYMKYAANMIVSGELDIDALYDMTDTEVVAELTKLHGVGVWTAEMLMLFSMQRPDVVSYGDLGIIRGMKMLYGHEKITKPIFNEYKKRYSPHGSVASLYLWAVSSGEYLDL